MESCIVHMQHFAICIDVNYVLSMHVLISARRTGWY